MKESIVIKKIEKYLINKGWSKNLQTKKHGCDIIVKKIKPKYGRHWLIEVKGDPGVKVKSPSGSRSSAFNSAVGQIITRMHTKRKTKYKLGYKYGIGFPVSFKNKVLNKIPFDVCRKLILSVFLVHGSGKVDEYSWKNLEKIQNK